MIVFIGEEQMGETLSLGLDARRKKGGLIFLCPFDDQHTHLSDSSKKIPCGRVLYKSNSILKNYEKEIIVEPKKVKEK